MLISETISQAGAAVARACTILAKENLSVGGIVAVVTVSNAPPVLPVCEYAPTMCLLSISGEKRR